MLGSLTIPSATELVKNALELVDDQKTWSLQNNPTLVALILVNLLQKQSNIHTLVNDIKLCVDKLYALVTAWQEIDDKNTLIEI